MCFWLYASTICLHQNAKMHHGLFFGTYGSYHPCIFPSLIFLWVGIDSSREPSVDNRRGDRVRQGQHRLEVARSGGDRCGQAEAQRKVVERCAHGLQGSGYLWTLQYYVKKNIDITGSFLSYFLQYYHSKLKPKKSGISVKKQ